MKTKTQIQEEALPKIVPLKRSGVAISMGVGKTLLGLRHMEARYKTGSRLFLVVAPKLSIFTSWRDDAETYGLTYLLEHIEFCTYVGLNKKNPKDYDGLYFDECHSLLETHEVFLSKYDHDILGLTGTAPKWENSEKGRMVAKYCPIVYEYIVDDAVGDGILNDYRIIIHKIKLNPARNFRKSTRDGRSWLTSELDDYRYWTGQIEKATSVKKEQIARIMRMKAMHTYASKEDYARKLFQSIDEKCILFCNTIDQARKLSAFNYTTGNPKSEDNLRMFKLGEIDKLACVLQLSEGVNIPGLKYGIIMHCYGNERKASQRIGRLLRLNPDDTATMHILCYSDSIDVRWTTDALATYDQDKITWLDAGQYQLT